MYTPDCRGTASRGCGRGEEMKRRDGPAGCSQVIEEPFKMDTARRRRELERPLYVDNMKRWGLRGVDTAGKVISIGRNSNRAEDARELKTYTE